MFSIAHLGDAERMFFVSLLLNQIVGWMRSLTGTSSLRAIVYMDEIGGYFPPVANPPSKGPLLTLLKQGRAFGVGVLLATQNPVDLDYKGLSNIGTWFIGRLQTERDKARLLDGLEGASAGALDRGEVDRILSSLGKRVFLLHDIHEKGLLTFETRWTMSYLRGPLSRDQIRELMAGSPAGRDGRPQPVEANLAPKNTAAKPVDPSERRPVVPPGVEQFFLPASRIIENGRVLADRSWRGARDIYRCEAWRGRDARRRLCSADRRWPGCRRLGEEHAAEHHCQRSAQ